MAPDSDDTDHRFDDAERAAREVADPATRTALESLIAALRASTSSSDYRSDELH